MSKSTFKYILAVCLPFRVHALWPKSYGCVTINGLSRFGLSKNNGVPLMSIKTLCVQTNETYCIKIVFGR